MNSRIRLQYGFELECGISGSGAGNLEIGSYHDGEPVVAGFTAERDGSLRNFPRGCVPVELVSSMFELKEFRSRWKALGDYLVSNDIDTLMINSDCGLHIHFSPLSCAKSAHKGIAYSDLSAIRRLWAKRVRAKFPQYADAILRQYNRGYARKATSLQGLLHLQHRAEFNIYDGKGIEWRGFNAQGVASGKRGNFEKDFAEVGKVLYEGLLVIREVLSKSCGRGYLFATRPKTIKVKTISVVENVRALESEIELPLYINSDARERVHEVLIG